MAVIFIGLMLLMAGVESNPGPPDAVFSFRYQYLLIEVGTSILRKVFDHQVGPGDFKQFLNNHIAAKGQLQFLINSKKITVEQQQFIPPVDNSPSSSNFDITLLCCLLRNVCGLRVFSDPVWINPSPTDTSIEAQVSRLKTCRNKLMHSGSVFDSETDLNAKWAELCSILTGLGNFCGMTNLQSLIDKAKTVDIDEQLKEKIDNMMIAWVEMDRLFDHGLGEVVQCQEKLEQKLSHGFETVVKEQQKTNAQLDSIEQARKRQKLSDDDEVKKDIQQRIVDVYQSGCFTLPISPLFNYENQELLKIYKIPSLSVVEYHNAKADQKRTKVTSCKDIFIQNQQPCRHIYITGDAGVGKSSFCTYMSLLWSMSRKQKKISNDRMQEDADFLAKFDYLFYVRLRDTDRTDVKAMIVDQLFYTESQEKWNKMYEQVETVLKCHESLVILDGLDEWSPKSTGKQDFNVPYRPTWEKCTYITTCRPYKIENVRLRNKDLDLQVDMAGLHGSSLMSYIAGIVEYINEKYNKNKNSNDFCREAWQCGLHELLFIPIITSNLVMLWLDQPLTAMSRSFVFGKMVQMLFQIAKDRKIEFPPSSSPEVQLPDSLSGLVHFREHFSLIEKVCLLSFRSLFRRDDCVTNLVFTAEQLKSDPYFLSYNEQDFLCKIGILSKNKVTRQFGKQEHKLSFLHQSYLEFFAAIFVSSFDASKLFATFNNLTTISEFLQFGNFFVFFAGLSPKNLESLIEQIHNSISDVLTSCRKNAIVHYNSDIYLRQIQSLQQTVIDCFKEGNLVREGVNLRHEDFVFGGPFDVVCLKSLLSLNSVKSLCSLNRVYYDEFSHINTLQFLQIGTYLKNDSNYYDEKFNELMIQNADTLHTVFIHGCIYQGTFIPDIPVSTLHQLTSLRLSLVEMHHERLCNLVEFLSANVRIEHINLHFVTCKDHGKVAPFLSDCQMTLDLSRHTKLESFYLRFSDIVCEDINTHSLKAIMISSLNIGVLKYIKGSQLEYLNMYGDYNVYNNTLETLTAALKTLPCIKLLKLEFRDFHEEVLLQLHPDVTQVEIEVWNAIMSRRYFHCFIDDILNKKSVIKVRFVGCRITVDGKTDRNSENYITEYLKQIPTIYITNQKNNDLDFETVFR